MVTRTIASDPWSLDKHLVVMQQYEKKSAIEELSFNQASFWVQLHCSPLCYMTTEATTKISLIIREVAQPIVPKDSEGGGGDFQRLKISINISLSRCAEDTLFHWIMENKLRRASNMNDSQTYVTSVEVSLTTISIVRSGLIVRVLFTLRIDNLAQAYVHVPLCYQETQV